ncbi:D-alanyl-D-alanine carboxypeptidase family protein [Paenibacillus sp.]|jgi:D-alanyl-D-alanine carboxypeptidase|uniref:D-alanyl-D-alanine carboxypeptidase family protein n=1 Tax=Paenibacillus sp. TaxID=58172 RepID=UPI0028192817|nr:D-alanyl-D-alanine carboxypeptidase family protein [Paenibacillus sp.]MDR0267266.1 D-alanyl-D-alanine carboxypeptidase [Paenibacillus sp.]
MWIKSITNWIVAAALLLFSSIPVSADSSQNRPNLYTHAQAAALMDVTSGRLLYSSHGDDELRIASLTKIMTAIVAIEYGDFKKRVKVSKKAFGKEGSSIYLKLGEEMTLENMLYGLMLRSGNDAATAIAEHVGGSEEGFVYLMNEEAKQIGLKHSHFANPHGLDADGHYSSANDLAKMTAYALHNPLFSEIVKTESKKAPNPNESWDYQWGNKNKMLRLYDGADGVKTGYTKKAFRCLVSSATRNGQQLVAVTLNDGDDWNDHGKMLDYGFEYYPLSKLMEKGEAVKGYDLVVNSTFQYPFAKGEEDRLEKKLVLRPLVKDGSTDVSFGLRGEIQLYLEGQQIGTVPVYQKGSFLPEGNARNPARTTMVPVHSSTFVETLSNILKRLFLQQN